MRRAIADPVKGLGFMRLHVDEEALEHIARMANGDIRRSLNALELAALTTSPEPDGTVQITLRGGGRVDPPPHRESGRVDAVRRLVRFSQERARLQRRRTVLVPLCRREARHGSDDVPAASDRRLQRRYRPRQSAGDGAVRHGDGRLS